MPCAGNGKTLRPIGDKAGRQGLAISEPGARTGTMGHGHLCLGAIHIRCHQIAGGAPVANAKGPRAYPLPWARKRKPT